MNEKPNNINKKAHKKKDESRVKIYKRIQIIIASILIIFEIIYLIILYSRELNIPIELELFNNNSSENISLGDYVEYDVEYTDAFVKEKYFTKEEGWRLLTPGKRNKDGTYNGAKLISTGIPIRLYYNDDEIKKADGINNYPWKYKEAKDKRIIGNNGIRYNFDKIKVLPSDPGGDETKGTGGYKTGAAWREKIVKNGVEITGEKNINELLSIDGITKENGIKCLDTDTIEEYITKYDYIMDMVAKRSRIKDEEEGYIYTMLNMYAAYQNVYDLQNVDYIRYLVCSRYRLVSIGTNHPMAIYGRDFSKGNIGLRIVIELKDNARIK